jgi:hypothetical protein
MGAFTTKPPSRTEKARRRAYRRDPVGCGFIRTRKRLPAAGGGFVRRVRHISIANSAAANARDAGRPLRKWGAVLRLVRWSLLKSVDSSGWVSRKTLWQVPGVVGPVSPYTIARDIFDRLSLTGDELATLCAACVGHEVVPHVYSNWAGVVDPVRFDPQWVAERIQDGVAHGWVWES